MNDKNSNPFVTWRKQHPHHSVDHETNIRIYQWQRVMDELLGLFEMFDTDIEPWIQGRKLPEPDFVAFVAGYGYTRTVTGNWKTLPIDIPEDQLEAWRENSGLVVTIDELRDWQAGVAGIIPTVLHARQAEFVALVTKQLTKLYDELGSLADKPLADFEPTQWPEEALGDEVIDQEVKELDRIFDLYEELWCFEQGIEELRMFMITENSREFHLPSKKFYEALKSINSQKLLETLHAAEPKLRQILKLWSDTTMSYTGKPYHRPHDENALAAFWWRHQKPAQRPRPQQNRNRSSRSR